MAKQTDRKRTLELNMSWLVDISQRRDQAMAIKDKEERKRQLQEIANMYRDRGMKTMANETEAMI